MGGAPTSGAVMISPLLVASAGCSIMGGAPPGAESRTPLDNAASGSSEVGSAMPGSDGLAGAQAGQSSCSESVLKHLSHARIGVFVAPAHQKIRKISLFSSV